jgi:hypothetical protein
MAQETESRGAAFAADQPEKTLMPKDAPMPPVPDKYNPCPEKLDVLRIVIPAVNGFPSIAIPFLIPKGTLNGAA